MSVSGQPCAATVMTLAWTAVLLCSLVRLGVLLCPRTWNEIRRRGRFRWMDVHLWILGPIVFGVLVGSTLLGDVSHFGLKSLILSAESLTLVVGLVGFFELGRGWRRGTEPPGE